jgi:HlyD family secretion protein
MSETLTEYDELLDVAEHRWRNRLIGLAALAALVAGGAYALWATVLGGGGSTAAEIQTATVQRGSISQSLSTTGVAVAQSTADLTFEQAGTVSAVSVTLGQGVKQGDVLAEIKADDLQSAVVAAQVNLDSAQAQLDDLLGGSTAADLASADQSVLQAQANLDDAKSALNDLLDGASDTELRQAEQAVAAAQSQLAKAEESRQSLYTNSDDAVTAAEESVSRAEDTLVTAKLSLLNAGNTYCDAEDHLLSICADFTIPLNDAEIHQLTNSIADEISSADVVGDDLQIADAEPSPTPTATTEPTPQPTPQPTLEPEPTPTPEAEATATPTQSNTGNQTQTGSNLVQATNSLISANISYKNTVASLQTAQKDLEEAKKGPSSTDIAAADVQVAAAQLSLDEAEASLEELKAGPTQDDVNNAQNKVDAATAALTVAQAKRDDVYAGAGASDIELQREKVRQAEEAVKKAQENLGKAQLIAPFDGTVAELNVEVGDEVGAGGAAAAIVLNTPNALRLQLTFTESDVLSVKAGQSGVATFDAIQNTAFPIEIESVGTNPTSTQGVVTYQAWAKVLSAPASLRGAGAVGGGSPTAILATAAKILGMTEEELQAALQSGKTLTAIAEEHGMTAQDFQSALRQQAGGAATPSASAPAATSTPTPSTTPSTADSGSSETASTSTTPLPGMNASVTIILDQAQNVLTVPESAVQTEGRDSVVEVRKDDGSTEKVTVQTGLSDGTNIEITDGLEEGQTVIIPTRAATTSAQATQTAGSQRGEFRFFEGQGGGPSSGGSITVPGGGAP